jgi:hypothetical protein
MINTKLKIRALTLEIILKLPLKEHKRTDDNYAVASTTA